MTASLHTPAGVIARALQRLSNLERLPTPLLQIIASYSVESREMDSWVSLSPMAQQSADSSPEALHCFFHRAPLDIPLVSLVVAWPTSWADEPDSFQDIEFKQLNLSSFIHSCTLSEQQLDAASLAFFASRKPFKAVELTRRIVGLHTLERHIRRALSLERNAMFMYRQYAATLTASFRVGPSLPCCLCPRIYTCACSCLSQRWQVEGCYSVDHEKVVAALLELPVHRGHSLAFQFRGFRAAPALVAEAEAAAEVGVDIDDKQTRMIYVAPGPGHL